MMRILTTGLILSLFLGGCETLFTTEVRIKAGGVNFDPPVNVDCSQMPAGSVVVESEDVKDWGNKRHRKVVYAVKGPAIITITPWPATTQPSNPK